MFTKGRRRLLAVGVIGAVLAGVGGAGAALAGPGGGGGHGGGGGGGHAGGGGGGGRSSGGGTRGGVAGGHFGGVAGGHYAPGGHFAGGAAHGYAGVTRGYAGGSHAAPYGGHSAYGYGGRGGYAYGGGGYHRGYSTGATWGGGYWRGGYWPRAYYGLGYSWFLPILPLAYATYWYSGVPYYYANDVYYTWSPEYQGYTATDPPPVDGSATPSDADGSAQAPNVNDASVNTGAAPGSAGGGQIFMYPKNGQSDAQQSTDKRECQQWASDQAGQGAANNADYRRAMMACLQGRGYSAN